MSRGGNSILNLGVQPNGTAAYSAKMGSGNRLKVHFGPYNSSYASPAFPVCNIESKNTFSSKTTISFANFSSFLKKVSLFHEGVTWPFEVNVNGTKQMWQWQMWQSQKPESGSALERIVGSSSDYRLGSWKLVPASGGDGNPAAVFEPGSGSTMEEDSDLGMFEFRGPAAGGEMGDVFMNVVVAVLLRIFSQHYVILCAGLAGKIQ